MMITFIWICFAILDIAISSDISSINSQQKRDSSRDYCNKTVDVFEDISSPELTSQNYGRALTCTYRFRTLRSSPRDLVLRLRFKKFKIGTLVNATHCQGGYLQITDGNSKTDVSNRREPGVFCGEIEQPQTFISETSYVKVLFHTDNFTDQTYFQFDSRAEQQLEVFLRYGQHPELYPNRRGEVVQGSYCEREYRDCRLQACYVQSPAYPGVYPRALKCRYKLQTRQPFIKLYLQNEQFNVDGQRCENIMTCPMRSIGSGNEYCPYDWLAIYDGVDEYAPLIGKFCGIGKFPFSIIGTTQNMFVEFVSSPAGPLLNNGFHFNVGNWPGQVETAGIKRDICDWSLTSDALRQTSQTEGIFLSIAHWYPPNTICNYHIEGRKDEIIRLYFPSFRINRIEAPILPHEGDCAESLTIYDSSGPDPARIIKTFCDTFSRPMEKIDFVSTSSSLFVRFKSKTGSYSGSSLYYWAHYDFFNNTRYGDPVFNTLCDENIYAWKRSEGRIRSPLNTLIFKRTAGSDVRCQYKFLTDKRLYARVLIEVLSVSFKELAFNMNACTRCHEERVDKLIIWEEKEESKTQDNLACFCDNIPRAVRVISSSSEVNLEMIVQGQHAITSYFKNPNPLFEANYEFVHGPLCGPITFGPSPEGELVFPYRKALVMMSQQMPIAVPASGNPTIDYSSSSSSSYSSSYSSSVSSSSSSSSSLLMTNQSISDKTSENQQNMYLNKKEKCIWELKVAAQRDLWLHLEKSHFKGRTCENAKIEVYLSGRLEPRFIVCPENISSARDLPILSAAELGALGNEQEALPVLIQYTGDGQPGRNAFRIVWTELFHLPRNSDGSLALSLLQDNNNNNNYKKNNDYNNNNNNNYYNNKYNNDFNCDFKCPDDFNTCLTKLSLCNGIMDCPNATNNMIISEDYIIKHNIENLNNLGIKLYDENLLGNSLLHDESPEICSIYNRFSILSLSNFKITAGIICLIFAIVITAIFRFS
ncbi:uncharacterized protein LOC129611271 isoform X2 [Condylostylus longicornis]|nr:uncharacterized protein LOC129611271 isoform X2 [Condylostylus longicornis]